MAGFRLTIIARAAKFQGESMKFTIRVALVLTLLALFLGTAGGQSLGEAARKARKNKPAPSPAQRVYTNDNLPTNAPISVMSGSGVNAPAAQDSKSSNATASTASAKSAGPSGEDDKKEQDEWRRKFAEQKEKIQLLEREVGVLEREYRLQVAVFYADAGARLRDDRKFADADRQYKANIETKKRDLASAKQQLEDMREEARKAGVPASVSE